MAIFGPDISSFQAGLNLARLGDASFVIAKTTEGTYYTDKDYDGWRLQAAALKMLFAWYHFLSGENATAQAAHTAAHVGDALLPGMLDFEPEGNFHPTLAQAVAYVDAAHAAGLNLRLVYLPHWYHQQLGSPDLGAFRDRGLQLVSSAYPGGTGAPSKIYPGDAASGWNGYGRMYPMIYQFTDKATDGGQPLDYNAFRGTRTQLVAALAPPSTPPTPIPAPPSTSTPEDDLMPAFATGQINPGADAVTVVCPPPPGTGSAGWGACWFSLASDFGDAHVRVAVWTHGEGWSHIFEDVLVPQYGDRANPLNGTLPNGAQKISIKRLPGSENLPMSYLIEATHR